MLLNRSSHTDCIVFRRSQEDQRFGIPLEDVYLAPNGASYFCAPPSSSASSDLLVARRCCSVDDVRLLFTRPQSHRLQHNRLAPRHDLHFVLSLLDANPPSTTFCFFPPSIDDEPASCSVGATAACTDATDESTRHPSPSHRLSVTSAAQHRPALLKWCQRCSQTGYADHKMSALLTNWLRCSQAGSAAQSVAIVLTAKLLISGVGTCSAGLPLLNRHPHADINTLVDTLAGEAGFKAST